MDKELKFDINLMVFWNIAIDSHRLQLYADLLNTLPPQEIVTVKVKQATVQCRRKDMMPLLVDIQDYPDKIDIQVGRDEVHEVVRKILDYLES